MRLYLIGGIVTLVLALLVAPSAAAAPAPTHIPRIGVLSQFAPPAQPSPAFEGFRAGLRELGYTEGRTVALEYRYAKGDYAQLAPLAAALVRLPVDIVVALSPPAIQAAVQATATLPIVGIGVPTGAPANVTGVDTGAEAFRQTWHALLTEALPGASRVALLWDATLGPPPGTWARAAARVMGVQLLPLMVAGPDAFAGRCQLNSDICKIELSSGTRHSFRSHLMTISGMSELQKRTTYPQSGRGFIAHQLS